MKLNKGVQLFLKLVFSVLLYILTKLIGRPTIPRLNQANVNSTWVPSLVNNVGYGIHGSGTNYSFASHLLWSKTIDDYIGGMSNQKGEPGMFALLALNAAFVSFHHSTAIEFFSTQSSIYPSHQTKNSTKAINQIL